METRIFNNLPCVLDDGGYVVFSPYAKKITKVPQESMDTQEVAEMLEERGFFGSPYECPGQCSDLYQLTVILTSDCNLRCTYCFVKGGSKKVDIAWETAKKAVDKAIENMRKKNNKKGLLVSFFGGEPTLCMDTIEKTVNYVRESIGDEYKCKFGITSNGVFNESTLRYLVDNDFYITISMDGLPEIQDRQRPLQNGKGSSQFVEKTIQRLKEEKADFMIRLTITSESVNHMPEIVRYLSKHGAQVLHFEAVNLAGRAIEAKGNTERPMSKLFAEKLIEAMNVAKDTNTRVMNSAYMNILKPSKHYCDGVGGNKLVITYDGEYTTCLEVQDNCHPVSKDFIVGDCKSQSLEKSYLSLNPIIEKAKECKDCFAKYVCSGGCPTRNYHIKGDIFSVDEFRCDVTRTLLKHCIMEIYQNSQKSSAV